MEEEGKAKGIMFLDTAREIMDKRKRIVTSKFEFVPKDKNKCIKTNDICNSVSSARNIVTSLELLIKNGVDIDNVGLSNRVVQFTAHEKYRVYLYVFSKEEMSAMPRWCKSNNTKRGM